MLDLKTLSPDGSGFIKKIREYFLTVGEGTVELTINLVVMVLVERFYDQQALGIYAYLLSLLFIISYISEFGIPRFTEHQIAKTDRHPQDQFEILSKSGQTALCLSLLVACLLFLSAGYDAAHTRIGERTAAYLIIAVILPLRCLNRLKLSVLHGHGRHDLVAKLQTTKRLIFLGAIFLLLLIRVPPSYLFLAFLSAEIFLTIATAVKRTLPGIWKIWIGFRSVRSTLSQGYQYLFTDDALDVVLYVDFLILGVFVSSWELGVYAEASILARFFLLVPISIKPIFRRRYTVMTAQGEYQNAATTFHRTTKIMFYLQSLLALYVLLHFEEVLHTFYRTHGEELLSFKIFTVLVPGLIYFAAVTSQEAVYEATEMINVLRKLAVIIAGVNIVLNIYLVPFAGGFGAASATLISMLAYFLLFDLYLDKAHKIRKLPFLFAGAGVYLIYMLMRSLSFGVLLDLLLCPIILFIVFYFMGFFIVEEDLQMITIHQQNFIEGGLNHGRHKTGKAEPV
ncbi:MAG: oligosaccharide flippase family protein [Desulfobacteraceae bacterium]|jgi:O-antigen/teichoic acid export membrane protein